MAESPRGGNRKVLASFESVHLCLSTTLARIFSRVRLRFYCSRNIRVCGIVSASSFLKVCWCFDNVLNSSFRRRLPSGNFYLTELPLGIPEYQLDFIVFLFIIFSVYGQCFLRNKLICVELVLGQHIFGISAHLASTFWEPFNAYGNI
ncbi:hypothetical protein EGR_01597 [Echinococcus granulosus]|uniref:Uncharacterized protein n=1 Tax=Echinococcus granulosus TaxID=6210 RepID=W6UPE9_ECHGR|nr:hypothetical protein EGR_01597 [Echinococcus granulosus]EUB63515.1 hypothetical protein EGR_01597 [Echinococcus granulosus]